MKLTQQLRTDILDVYEAFWGSLFNVDIEIYARVLDNNYRLIGTTDKEFFFNKKEAIQFLKSTAVQLAGNIERRKSKYKIEKVGGLVLITEQFDAYVLIDDEWTFYGKTRVSTWMQQKTQGWKIIQQHFSFPDTKAEEGETLGLEKISKENLELREAIQRRTIELENKNRELEIETALEKVRAIALGMKQPADMLDICKTIALQLQLLGTHKIRNVQTAIFYEDKGMYMNYEYYARHDKTFITETSYTNHKIHLDFASQMLRGKDEFYHTHIAGKKKLKDWIAYQKTTNVFIDPFIETAESLDYYWYSLGPVALGTSTYEPLTDEETSLFKRFLKVFELAYRRYLDIESAEAQARESQIQLALERVRARSMAMQKSEELLEVIQVLSEQFIALGFKIGAATFALNFRESNDFDLWMAVPGRPYITQVHVPYFDHPLFHRFIEAKERGQDFIVQQLSFDEKNAYFEHFFKNAPAGSKEEINWVYKSKGYAGSEVLMKSISLGIANLDAIPYTDKENAILKRFATAFEQSYTRFTDLQNAEAQVWEAKIEAALERVRAQAMAMHRPDELLNVCEVMYRELKSLGFDEIRNAMIHTFNPDNEFFLDYDFSGTTGGKISRIPTKGFSTVERYLEGIKKDSGIFLEMVLTGEELESWKNTRKATGQLDDPRLESLNVLYYYYYSIGVGDIGISTFSSISKEKMQVLERFRNVFQLSYQRYSDIEKAEAQAREAQIEAALERVRSVAMSMMKTEDLAAICKAVFTQLLLLGFSDLRASQVYIRDDKEEKFVNYDYSDETGALKQEISYNSHPNTRKVYDIISKAGDELIITVIDKHEMEKWKSYLYDTIGQKPEKSLEHADELHYYLYSFGIGAFGISNFKSITAEELQILKRFRNVFSLSYQRYTDISQAEAHALQAEQDLIEIKAARQKAEAALTELRSTQKQLIQSEKMASLGELTAGIAHEIQNPLNFVNNFSDVNKELVEELKTELATGNLQLATEIANDLKENSEKINHHGKRADAIVKGMLQHSRSSSNQKEPTDINALCDEYLRLSYHGLRAKDKSFNATLKTDFDNSFGKINIIPQDIGRVILNLVNNAFYAVAEKKRSAVGVYEPTVSISTRPLDSMIKIEIGDNGNGIPGNIVDKIFQPFFTTKPTGQGTGLGLSLSYDIVKAHGGELKVESKEGEGSSFILCLPTD